MPADGLTKALPRQKYEAFIQQLGLVDLSQIDLMRAQETDTTDATE
jgi:hypothetical protein